MWISSNNLSVRPCHYAQRLGRKKDVEAVEAELRSFSLKNGWSLTHTTTGIIKLQAKNIEPFELLSRNVQLIGIAPVTN